MMGKPSDQQHGWRDTRWRIACSSAWSSTSQDSDALFRAIERHNPHAAALRTRFFEAARALDARLSE